MHLSPWQINLRDITVIEYRGCIETTRICLMVNNCPSKYTQIYQSIILLQHRCGVFERWGLWGGIVVATMVVGGVLSTRVSAAQHCCQCWPDVQCETDPSMYLYVFV